jgi:hypothetical protein
MEVVFLTIIIFKFIYKPIRKQQAVNSKRMTAFSEIDLHFVPVEKRR